MNNIRPFCIISIDGNFNKFSSNFSKLNNSFCFAIDSHKELNESELKEKTKDFYNVIIVLALGGRYANEKLLKVLEVLKDKNCLIVANTPFDFEGKKSSTTRSFLITMLILTASASTTTTHTKCFLLSRARLTYTRTVTSGLCSLSVRWPPTLRGANLP